MFNFPPDAIAYSYIRCSTPKQLLGDTKRRQMKAAEDYAKLHNLTLSKTGYHDLGVSAYKSANRKEGGQLFALLAAIQDGKIPVGSVLLVENLDRLSRDYAIEAFEVFLGIIRNGITVVSLMEPMIYNRESLRKDPSPLNYSLMVLQRGHEESKSKSIRIQGAWEIAQKNAETKKIGQSYPAWLELKDNKFKILPQQANIIKGIFKAYLSGKGTGAIARDLNSRGILTFTGCTWYQTTVKFYLRFPAVIGEYHAGKRAGSKKVKTGKVVKGYYPSIISESDWYKVQAKFNLQPEKHGRPQRPEANLFSGIIKCGYCGGSMGIYNAAKSNSFVCWNGVSGGCIRVAFPAHEIEAHLITTLEITLKDLASRNNDTNKVAELEGRIVEINGKIQNFTTVIEQGADLDGVVSRLKELKKDKSELERSLERERAISKAPESPTLWQDWIIETDADPSKRTKIIPYIRRHVECIRVYPVGESKDQYEAMMKGKNGSRVYHEVRKKLKVQLNRYFEADLNYPVKLDGKMVTTLQLDKKPYHIVPDDKGGFKTVKIY